MLFPIVTLLGVSGIVVGILNSYDHFTVPALSPVFWNLAIIAGLAIGVPHAHSGSSKLYVYAASILAATFIQVFLPMPWLRSLDRGDNRLRVLIDWHDPAVWRVFKMMVPVTLGLGLINVNAVIDTFFASRLINGNLAPNAIQKAFLVYMLPQGMFSVAVATVLFPTLSRLASRGDAAGFRSAGVERPAADRLPARAGRGRQRHAGSADRPHPLPARPLPPGPDAGRRERARRVQRRARVQRDDAAAEPGVLQPAVELAARRSSRSRTCS